jgi:hypothetical protein
MNPVVEKPYAVVLTKPNGRQVVFATYSSRREAEIAGAGLARLIAVKWEIEMTRCDAIPGQTFKRRKRQTEKT